MPKTRIKFVCQQCGAEQSKWVGKCSDCGAWNSMEEVVEVPQSPVQQRRPALSGNSNVAQGTHTPLVLPEIKPLAHQRISVGYPEMDRVLGGGLVAGSLTLIGGEPGIG
ncbi:MAG: DNA repair protein RadA, partial [Ktedonobacteraceae bacterium]